METPSTGRQSSRGSTSRRLRESIGMRMDHLRRRFQLHKLWSSVLRSLVVSLTLLVILIFLTILVAVVFYCVNRNGNTDCDRYRELKARQKEYNDTLHEVLRMPRTAKLAEDGRLASRLMRLRQLGNNFVYKDVLNGIRQHELKPTFTQSLYYAVTLVSLIGYGDIAGASELQYFCASLSMLIVVPIWYMYHHQLYHLFYFLQLYFHRRWIQPESLSNRTMMVLWAVRIRNANVYRRSRFYLSNLVLMIIMFPLCLAIFAITDSGLSFSDELWLTIQSIFHIGLGDVPPEESNWAVIFFMISTCFLIFFQCFSFIMPQYPSLRLSRIVQNDYA